MAEPQPRVWVQGETDMSSPPILAAAKQSRLGLTLSGVLGHELTFSFAAAEI